MRTPEQSDQCAVTAVDGLNLELICDRYSKNKTWSSVMKSSCLLALYNR